MRKKLLLSIIFTVWSGQAIGQEFWLACRDLDLKNLKSVTVKFSEAKPSILIVEAVDNRGVPLEVHVSIQEGLSRNYTLPALGGAQYRLYFYNNSWHIAESTIDTTRHFEVSCTELAK